MIASSSMSNTSMPCGRPGAPLYASSSGTQNRAVSPTLICGMPSFQPSITPIKLNSAGAGRSSDESNMRPSVVQPV